MPVHEAHSIEQAVLILHFDRPLEQSKLSATIDNAKQFSTELPGGGNIVGGFPMSISGFPMQIMPIPAQMQMTGIILHRSAPDGSMERELRVDTASITLKTARYTRWSAIWEDTKRYYSALINAYLDNGSKISNISVNFVDKFIWDGEIKDFDPSLLLNKKSEYIANYIFTLRDLWHFHTGSFLRADEKTKRLININVDCLDEFNGSASRRAVLITSVLTDMFNQPSFEEAVITSDNAMDFITEHMKSLHALDKDILSKILVDSMTKQIALVG